MTFNNELVILLDFNAFVNDRAEVYQNNKKTNPLEFVNVELSH